MGVSPDDAAALSITVTDSNEAPTVALAGLPAGLPEDTDTATRVKVADIVVTDDLAGVNMLALTGADAALFEIDGLELFLKAGTALDFETNPVLDVAVTVDDASIGTGPEDTAVAAIAVTDANEAPSVALLGATTTLSEDASTATRTKVADIAISDDAIGTNVLGLTGDDADLFEIDGTELFLKAGAALDFETNPALDVAVTVDDASVGASPDSSAPLTIDITNVNEAPVVTLVGGLADLFEGTDTTGRIKVADIDLADDGTGTNVLGLAGSDAALFEIDGDELFLKAGTALNVGTNPVLDVIVTVDDAALPGSPDDIDSLAITVKPGAAGAATDATDELTFIGNAASVERFGQIEVADADPDTPGDQPGFVFNTDPSDTPYAGVAGSSLNLIDTTGHDGLVSLGVIAEVDADDFTLDNSGSSGDVEACIDTGNDGGVLVTPTLGASGTWIFDNTGASGDMDITLKALDASTGFALVFNNVDIVVDGDVDLTGLGFGLDIDAASTVEVLEGATLTLTVQQVDQLQFLGVTIFGEGTVAVTGISDDSDTDLNTNFGNLATGTVDLSAVTLADDDTTDAVEIAVSGALDDGGSALVDGDGVRVTQTVIGTAHNDAATVGFSASDGDTGTIDVILELGADDGDIGDPLDTPEGTADPAEMTGDTIDLDSTFADVQINADAGFDAVTGAFGLPDGTVVNVAAGAEFYAGVVTGDYLATAATTNDGTAVLEALGTMDKIINVALTGGSAGWNVIGGAGSTDTQLVGGNFDDTLVDGIPDDANNNNEEDVFIGNAGADNFVFNIGVSDVGTFTTTVGASDTPGVDMIEIMPTVGYAVGETLQFNFRIGAFAPTQVTLTDGVDGADLSTAATIAASLQAALNARADADATEAAGVVTGEGVNGARLDLINVVRDPGGAPVDVTVDFTVDNLTDAGAYANDAADTGDDDRAIDTIELTGPIAIGETYTIEVTRSDGSQFSGSFVTTTTSVQDAIDGLADALNTASGGDIGFSSLGAALAPPADTLPTAAATNQIVAYDTDADNGGFTITGASGTASISGMSASSILTGGGTLGAADADVINDFVSGDDTISFGLAAGSSSNYDEGAEVADFATAEVAANAAMDGTVIYYLTSSATAGEEGLLFFDANADGTADGVLQLIGIDASSFDDDDIV